MFNAPCGGWEQRQEPRDEPRKNKLPDLGAPLTGRLPLDTLYSLLADADFEKYQEEMDTMIEASVAG